LNSDQSDRDRQHEARAAKLFAPAWRDPDYLRRLVDRAAARNRKVDERRPSECERCGRPLRLTGLRLNGNMIRRCSKCGKVYS